jgi:secreted trypsin-like serine protease
MSPTKPTAFRLLLLASLGGGHTLGCTAEIGDNPHSPMGVSTEEVVGGSQEAGYPSAGYLVRGATGGNPTTRLCTAVQLGPNLVATGAHCFYDWTTSPPTNTVGSFSWGYGRGEVANSEIYTANSVTIHSGYNPVGSPRFKDDIALVSFNQSIGGGSWSEVVAPVLGTNCGTASASTTHTYVGYGRDTTGGSGVPGNVDGDRKSATQCIDTINTLDLRVTGVNGGLCWGDSGGPLFATGSSRVTGVLSDFDAVFDCQIGNDMIFTRLSAYKTFICGATRYVGNGAFCGRSFSAEVGTAQTSIDI